MLGWCMLRLTGSLPRTAYLRDKFGVSHSGFCKASLLMSRWFSQPALRQAHSACLHTHMFHIVKLGRLAMYQRCTMLVVFAL